jgi:futalosine hydrolase
LNYAAKLALHNGLDKKAVFCSMNILLTAATEAEIAPSIEYIAATWQPVEKHIFEKDDKQVTICISGVGMMATAYSLAKECSKKRFDIALQAGIAGAFDRSIETGEVVFVNSEQMGDLGAEDNESYLDIFELGLAQRDGFPYANECLNTPDADFHRLLPLRKVTGLTVNMVTGKEETVLRLAEKYNCQVESMEGAAFHYVCLQEKIPFAQIRGISNYIEPRNRAGWKIGDAILSLNDCVIAFVGQL